MMFPERQTQQSNNRHAAAQLILNPKMRGLLLFGCVLFSLSKLFNPFQETANTGRVQQDDLLHPDGMSCAPLRDVSNYSLSSKPGNLRRFPGCLRYECNYNETECDNNDPTNYDGPEMPCCIHILRDMAKEFDHIMCHLGLEYMAAYGMLLGLERSDRFIPWTNDNDYLMEEQAVIALKQHWNEAARALNHSLQLVHFNLFRFCAKPEFPGGKLKKWAIADTRSPFYAIDVPYSDIFTFKKRDDGRILDMLNCDYQNSDVWPLERRAFYNGTLYQQTPRNPEAILSYIYGPTWRTPDPRKSRHGSTNCIKKWKKKMADEAKGIATQSST